MRYLGKWSVAALLALGLVTGAVGQASAGNIEVQVGYADGLRPSPFFPNPWDGGTNVALFAGAASGGPMDYDAGAIRVINNGGSAISLQNLVVDGFGDGASYSIWGGYLVPVFLSTPATVRSSPRLPRTISTPVTTRAAVRPVPSRWFT